jgi:hypothetical protein
MATVAQAQLGISEAIQLGLWLETGPVESLESRTVETAPRDLSIMRGTRELFDGLDLTGISERTLLQLTANLLQMQDSVGDVATVLRVMVESGRAEAGGQLNVVERLLNQAAEELDWLEDKIETLTLSADKGFMSELNRRLESAPAPSRGASDWKQELTSLCD